VGYKILCLLRQQGANVVGIHERQIPIDHPSVVIGDPQSTAVLLKAGIKDAQTLILTSRDESINLGILMQARILNSQVRVINSIFNTSLGERLDQTLENHVSMSVAVLAAPVFAFAAMGNKAIGNLQLPNQSWLIHEEYIDQAHAWVDRQVSEFWEDRARMLIHYLPSQRPSFEPFVITSDNPLDNPLDLVSAVVHGYQLQVGDRLLIGTKPSKPKMERKRISQRIQNFLASLNQFQRYSKAVLLVAIALLLTILGSTFTFVILQPETTFIDALYFSMGVITGAGGNDKVVQNSGLFVRYFTVVMMIVGAAVIGIWYALLNDFILGTRLQQFLAATRVPQQNHYLVCGLGNVGIQVASLLKSYGNEVVIIESDGNNRYLNSARSLGMPVIIGDASLPSTLKSANLTEAQAILIVTSNDTINLEVALTAKAIAPGTRAVLRYENARFAEMAQQIFRFKFVLNSADIVAPAFAAAALGGRVLGNGIIGNHLLWVAIAISISANHPFIAKQVKDVAMLVDFVPLYVETSTQKLHGWDLLAWHLDIGNVLYLTIPAIRLEELWRVIPSANFG